MHISDPLPGNTHDAKAMYETGLNELLGDDNASATKATSELVSPPRFASQPAGSSSNGRKSSIPQSTRFAT
jgi:hypothetical protein